MKPKVYLETTIPSYATADTSQNLIVASKQAATSRFWVECRDDFDFHVSQAMLGECSKGDPELARRRLAFLTGVSVLQENEATEELAAALVAKLNLPKQAKADAVQLAVAAVYGLDFLLTWNCKHLANAKLWRTMQRVIEAAGFRFVTICTPYELLGEDHDSLQG